MPTYEYRCNDCGEHLEVVQSFSDDPLTKCPSCKGKLRKVFSPVGIVFKGSGFYKTDNRGGKGGSHKHSESSGSSSSDSSSSSSSSSDSSSSSSSSPKTDSKIA
ncbi:MAG TPA: FmdB family zinc ribbon protein [Acidimicrobiia bacterium]|nr:FmdB family zinc ribbon protein [Acidimicrobiia bacterium]